MHYKSFKKWEEYWIINSLNHRQEWFEYNPTYVNAWPSTKNIFLGLYETSWIIRHARDNFN